MSSLGITTPAAAEVIDATTTTLTITPTDQQYAGGTVTFDVAVTTTSGAIAEGFVAIQTTSVCGFGSPLTLTTLDPTGSASMTKTFAAPYEYQFTACFFNAVGTTFGDSQADTQAYAIVATSAPEITLHPVGVTAIVGETVTFTAAAIGTPSPTVQWQVWSTSSGVWVDLAGETSTTLSFEATALDSGNRYRAVFTNGTSPDATTNEAALRLTLGFEGFLRPLPRSRVAASSSIPVRFALVDAAGNSITPSAGIAVRVSLWSSETGGTIVSTGCSFSATIEIYVCVVRLPASLTRGATYWIAVEAAFSTDPWVLCPPVDGATTANPRPIRIK